MFYSYAMLAWLLVVVIVDIQLRKVRNWMVLLGLCIGAAALWADVHPLQISAASSLMGMAVAFTALLPFYLMRWMGAGDVKFAAVIGLWFGCTPNLLLIWAGGSVLAGLHAVLVLAWLRAPNSAYTPWLQTWLPAKWIHHFNPSAMASSSNPKIMQRSIPYAGYMAIAAMYLLIQSRST